MGVSFTSNPISPETCAGTKRHSAHSYVVNLPSVRGWRLICRELCVISFLQEYVPALMEHIVTAAVPYLQMHRGRGIIFLMYLALSIV